MTERLAVHPGTFDPLTYGHMSLVKRGLDVFDRIVVAVAADIPKKSLFTQAERVDIAREAFAHEPRVEVEGFSGLLVDYVRDRGAKVVLRGLRAVSDFEYEFQMALMNRHLDRGIQTVFLMTDYRWLYISSTIVKEAAKAGGDVSQLVPHVSATKLKERYAALKSETA